MPDTSPQLLEILVATYKDLDEAKADIDAVKVLYKEFGTSHNFEAAVIAKDDKGKVKVKEKYDASTRHGSVKGLEWGLAAGVVAALFPPVGIAAALAAGGVGGAGIGAVVGHAHNSMSRGDLKELGDALDNAEIALIVVYQTDLAAQVAKNIKATNQAIKEIADLDADAIASEIRSSGA